MSNIATAVSPTPSLDFYESFAQASNNKDQEVSDIQNGVKTSFWGRLVHYWCPKQRDPIIQQFKTALIDKYKDEGLVDFVFPEPLRRTIAKKGLTGSMIKEVIAAAETKSAEAKKAATAKSEVESKKATLAAKIAILHTELGNAENPDKPAATRLESMTVVISTTKDVFKEAEGLAAAAHQLVAAAEAVGSDAYSYAIEEAGYYLFLAQTQVLIADVFCHEAENLRVQVAKEARMEEATSLVSQTREETEVAGWSVDDDHEQARNATNATSAVLMHSMEEEDEEDEIDEVTGIPTSSFLAVGRAMFASQPVVAAQSTSQGVDNSSMQVHSWPEARAASASGQQQVQKEDVPVSQSQKLGDSWVNVGVDEEEEEVFAQLEKNDAAFNIHSTQESAEASEVTRLTSLALQSSKIQIARDHYDHVSQLLTQAQEEHYTILSDSYSLGRLYTQDKMLENFIGQPANKERSQLLKALKSLETKRQASLALLAKIKALQGVLKTAVMESSVVDMGAISAEIQDYSEALSKQASVKASPAILKFLKLHLEERYPRSSKSGLEEKAPLEIMGEETAAVLRSFLQERQERPFVDWKTKVSREVMLQMINLLKNNERMAYEALEAFANAEALEQAVESSVLTLKHHALVIQNTELQRSAERDSLWLEVALVSIQEYAQKNQLLLGQTTNNFNNLCKAKAIHLRALSENTGVMYQTLQEYRSMLHNLKELYTLLSKHQAASLQQTEMERSVVQKTPFANA